jgi:hypothetical protein
MKRFNTQEEGRLILPIKNNMATKIYDQFKGKHGPLEIEKFESYIGHELPTDYKRFLIKNNGGRTKPDAFKTISDEMESLIHFIYGFTEGPNYDLKTNYDKWKKNDFPKKYLPIAIDALGNYIVLDLSESHNYGHVLFWSHDTPELRPVEISVNFNGFIKSLFLFTLKESDLDIAIATQNKKYFKNRIANGEFIDNIKNEFGQTVIVMASLRNKLQLVKFFHENGSKMDKALFSAARNGHYVTVKYLLTLGLNPDERDITQNNDTALIQAAFGGYIDVVKLLIEYGADINATDKHGQSVLRKAYWSNNDALIAYLEKLGAKA